MIQKLNSLRAKSKVFLVAIDGRGGSGKSTLARKLSEAISDIQTIHLDDFATDPGVDRKRLLDQVLIPLKSGQPTNYQRFDWDTKKLGSWEKVEVKGTIIIEGVSTLHDDLNQHFDFRIWVECPTKIGFERGLKRDRDEFGIDTKEKWLNLWMPEEKKYIDSQNPREKADYIYFCSSENETC